MCFIQRAGPSVSLELKISSALWIAIVELASAVPSYKTRRPQLHPSSPCGDLSYPYNRSRISVPTLGYQSFAQPNDDGCFVHANDKWQ